MFSTHDGVVHLCGLLGCFCILILYTISLITWNGIHAKLCRVHILIFSVKSNQSVTVRGAGKRSLCTLQNQDTAGCTSGLRSVWNNSWNALKYTAWKSAISSFFQVSVPETNTCLTTKIIWQLYYITNQFISTCEDRTDMQDWLGRSGKNIKIREAILIYHYCYILWIL